MTIVWQDVEDEAEIGQTLAPEAEEEHFWPNSKNDNIARTKKPPRFATIK